MATNAKKATFSLSADILAAVHEAVVQGTAPSKNALVERAPVRELQELRRQARGSQWEAAARDQLFMKDLEDTGTAFGDAATILAIS